MKMPTHVPFIDAHLHLDQYTPAEQQDMLRSLPSHQVEAVIAVSMHLASSQATMDLAARHPHAVFPAIGFHPEQPLPSPSEAEQLFDWIERRIDQAVAIGEVGLPITAARRRSKQGNLGTNPATFCCSNVSFGSPKSTTNRSCCMPCTKMPMWLATCWSSTK